MEPELENAILELTSESVFVGVFPFAADDLEGDVFVRRAGGEAERGKVLRVRRRGHRVLRRGITRLTLLVQITI